MRFVVRAVAFAVIAAGCALLPGCGDQGDGSAGAAPDDAGATNVIDTTGPKGATGPAVVFFMGELGQSDKTVCVADREIAQGTNVIAVRDHSRQYDVSVVKYAEGHREAARELAARLGIDTVAPMDPVTPTLFPVIDVAAIIAGDYRSVECRA